MIYMKANVTYWLDQSAERLPDKIAFADEHKEITFGQLKHQAMALATRKMEKGLIMTQVVIYL